MNDYLWCMSRTIHDKRKSKRGRFVGSVVVQRALDSGLGLREACIGRNVYKEITWREGKMHDGIGDVDRLMLECKMLERYL